MVNHWVVRTFLADGNFKGVLLFYSINESWLRNAIKTNVKFCHGVPFNRIVLEVLEFNAKYLRKKVKK